MDETTVITAVDAATEVLSFMQGDITLGTIISVIGVGLGACIGIFLGQWAIRKVARMVITAFSRGRIRF